jgi:hypothetical protein
MASTRSRGRHDPHQQDRKIGVKKKRLDWTPPVSEAEYREVTANVSRNGANATMVEGMPEAMTNQASIANLIGAAGLPAIHTIPKFVDAGHLMAHSIDVAELNKRAANAIDASFAVRSKLEVRIFHQAQDREGARRRRPGNAPGQRRQCHRMKPPPNVAFWALIPRLIDQNRCAHWRNPMDMIFQGRSMSVFQA